MELRKLFKNTSYLASVQIFQFFTGIIRSKLSAIIIGTYGLGIYSQVQNLIIQISNLTQLGTNEGAVKLIAENKANKDSVKVIVDIIASYSLIVIIISISIIVIVPFFIDQIAIFYLGGIENRKYIFLGLICLPFVLVNSISFALLKSFKRIKEIAKAQIIIILINFFLFLPLLYLFTIDGAVISIVLSFIVTFLINTIYASKTVLKVIGISFNEIRNSRINKPFIKELLLFVGVGSVLVVSSILVEFVSRSLIVNKLGIHKIGIYAPLTAWGGLIFSMIIPSLNTYLFPRFSEAKSNEEIISILNDVFRLITFIMIPILLLSLSTRKFIITLFYSEEFLEAAVYLPLHFIGLLFLMWMQGLTQVFAPTGRIKMHGFIYTIFTFSKLIILITLIDYIGIWAWVLQFSLVPLLFWIIYFYYLKSRIKLKIFTNNFFLMCYAVLAAILVYSSPLNEIVNAIIALTLALFTYKFLSESEKNYLSAKLQYAISKYIKK